MLHAWNLLLYIKVFCDSDRITEFTFLHELSVYVTELCFTAKRPALPVILRHSLSASFSVKSLDLYGLTEMY